MSITFRFAVFLSLKIAILECNLLLKGYLTVIKTCILRERRKKYMVSKLRKIVREG